MASLGSIKNRSSIRIWNWVSPKVNHPRTCAPSHWLLERLSETLPADQISDEVWKIARRSLSLHFPGLDRPLGSCYHPDVRDVLDVAYHYGAATQRALRKVASAAAEIVHSDDGLWSVVELEGNENNPTGVGYIPPTARRQEAHINKCPEMLRQLAEAVRQGRAPEMPDIRPTFFKDGWNEARIEEVRRDTEARQKLALIADVLVELKVSLFEAKAPGINVQERWYDQYHCPHGRHTNSWFTDGRNTEVSSEELERPHGYFGGGGQESFRIEGATYAFSRDFAPGNGGGGRGTYSVRAVYVWPGYDPAVVAAALKNALK